MPGGLFSTIGCVSGPQKEHRAEFLPAAPPRVLAPATRWIPILPRAVRESASQVGRSRGFALLRSNAGLFRAKSRESVHAKKYRIARAAAIVRWRRIQSADSLAHSACFTAVHRLTVPRPTAAFLACFSLRHERMKSRPTPMQMALSGNIERREVVQHARAGDKMEIQEIDHVMVNKTIDQIAENPAEDQSQRDRTGRSGGTEFRAHEHKHHQCDRGDDGQRPIVAVKHAPGRAGIVPMNQAKKAGTM